MSQSMAALDWVPIVCNTMIIPNGVGLLRSISKGDREGIGKYALRIAAFMFVSGLAFFVECDYIFASLEGFMCAIYLIVWWHNGGGDNFKRRLKKFKETFVGTRRTAPQTA